jgi:microcystin-dependent protein
MAEGQTPNFKWILPDIGGDSTTWGTVLNQTLTSIDSVAFANQNAGVPIGSITMFAGATAPPNWVLCNGGVYPVTAPYAGLFAVIGAAYGGDGVTNFAVPNLVSRLPYGAGSGNLGSTGGTTAGNFSFTIGPTQIPAHTHPVSDPQHYHVVAAYTHTHGVSDPTHTHGASAGDSGQHSHGSNLLKFVGSGSNFGIQSAPGNVSAVNTDASNAPGVNVSIAYAATGINQTAAAATGIPNTNYAATGITQTGANTGGGAAVNFIPPVLAINFIIRYQ